VEKGFLDLAGRLSEHLSSKSGRAYLVGGVIRDHLLGRTPRDIDLLLEIDPGEERSVLDLLSALAGMEPVVFEKRPPETYRVVMDGIIVDTSFCPAGGIDAALRRRDFTINAMAAPLPEWTRALEGGAAGSIPLDTVRDLLVDPAGGLEDLRAGRIDSTTPAALEEDPLRMLRAVRLTATLSGFRLTGSLEGQIRLLAAGIFEAAPERVAGEMEQIFESDLAGRALREMESLGLLSPILPELEPLRGLRQPDRYHDHDVFEHSLRAVSEADPLAEGMSPLGIPALAGREKVILKWAALLHDAGKAATVTVDPDGTPHFHGHEKVSASLAAGAMEGLRIPSRVADPVVALIQDHLRPGALASARAGDKPVRRLIRSAGENLHLLLLHALADRRASGGESHELLETALVKLSRRALALRDEVDALAAAPPLLTGHEVMEMLGCGPGPRVGGILRWIDRLRTEGQISSREEAVTLIQNLPPPRIAD
jgi:poly(A) polymerase